MIKFSERLKKLRQERGLKQREMAEICGLKLRGYQCYEYATSCPDFDGLVFLADYFNVSTDYLLGRTDCREMNQAAPDGTA
ncbi:helix-turn-helix domain-containing protein [Flintibacter muris]|uniref:helix-turn-helix domain-containing protein n=1 Tax=Flintibacter muris TaxID=2941327 RepID=UPI00203AA357|nr:helix-turn-helix transcriptional regulator [Flintibacter muris]